jgi:hypothetical protein
MRTNLDGTLAIYRFRESLWQIWERRILQYSRRIWSTHETALRSTQPPIQWVLGALSLGLKRPGREADYSSHLVPRSKNVWSYTSTPQYAFIAWCLVKHRGNFTFTLHAYIHTHIRGSSFSLFLHVSRFQVSISICPSIIILKASCFH